MMDPNQIPSQVASAKTKLLVCIVLALITLLLYGPARHFDFINYDDDDYITRNHMVTAGLTRSTAQWAFTTAYSSNWHPLTWISHMTDVQLWGLQAGGHHLTNVLLHAATSLLLFLVLAGMTGSLQSSALVAAIFAWHPLHVESVAWVSERKDVLSALFWVLTIGAYWRYTAKPALWNYAAVVVCFALGLLSKPMVVTLPLVLLLLDYWPLHRFELAPLDWRRLRFLILEKAPLLLLSVVSIRITVLAQAYSGAMKSSLEVPWQVRLANVPVSYAKYLVKAIWPSNLSVFYPLPSAIPVWEIVAATLLLLAITSFALFAIKRHPFLAFGWFWYLGTLVPVIGLVQVGDQALADRYTYIPIIGLAIAAVWTVWELLRPLNNRHVVGAALAIGLGIFWVQSSSAQLRHWKNSVTLFQHALAVDPNNWLAHNNLANAFMEKPETLAIAEEHARAALHIRPNYPQAWLNLGVAQLRAERTSDAISSLRRAVESKPRWEDAHFNLGAALMVKGDIEDAMSNFYTALDINPDSIPALKAIAWIRSTTPDPQTRNAEEAGRLASRAGQLTNYDDAEILDVLAASLAEGKRFKEAQDVAEKALAKAISHRNQRLAPLIQNRLELYKLEIPYRSKGN